MLSSLVLPDYLERKFLKVLNNENLIHCSAHAEFLHRHIDDVKITADDLSYINSLIFLYPNIILSSVYEKAIESKTEYMSIDQADQYQSDTDVDPEIARAYIQAHFPEISFSTLNDEWADAVSKEKRVLELFQSMPQRSGNSIATFSQIISSTISRAPLTEPSLEQRAAFDAYEDAKSKIDPILRKIEELNGAYQRRKPTDFLALHPTMQKTFVDVTRNPFLGPPKSELEVFFLIVKSLRTLPVGRNIKESLELSKSKEGLAIREKVSELYYAIQDGTAKSAQDILSRLDHDADEYRKFTHGLQNRSTIGPAADFLLSAVGNIPFLSLGSSTISMLRAVEAMDDAKNVARALTKFRWAMYQGRSL